MKKTLIALAALGVVGAASAQATVSGDISFGFAGAKNGTTDIVTQGFGTRSGNITFGVSEDLGGGLSVKASAGIDSVRANDDITGNGANLTVSGGFGSLALNGAEESCNGIVGQAGGANIDDLNIGFDCGATGDNMVYTAPAFGPVTVKVLVGNGTNGYGTGNYTASTYYLDYAEGPIKAGVDLTTYSAATTENRTRIKASYDLGMAVISVGSSRGGVAAGSKNDQSVWGVSIPMGATTVGVGSASATTTAKVSGTGLNVTYALSKQTTLVFTTASATGTMPSATANKKRSEIYLKKAF